MNKNLMVPAILILLLMLPACKKERLPEPSQHGANMIACKVNNKVWKPDAGTSFNGKEFTLVYNDLFKPRLYFVLSVNRITKEKSSHITIALEDVQGVGTQYFNSDTRSYPGDLYFKNHASYVEDQPDSKGFITNSRHKGFITIAKLNTVRHIVAGTIEFTAENLYCLW